MGIFNRKKEYVIVTEKATTVAVRTFANEHCDDGCEVDVHVHGCLLEGDNLVTITFNSKEPETIIYSELIDKFAEEYRLAIRRNLIFVFEKKEEES